MNVLFISALLVMVCIMFVASLLGKDSMVARVFAAVALVVWFAFASLYPDIVLWLAQKKSKKLKDD